MHKRSHLLVYLLVVSFCIELAAQDVAELEQVTANRQFDGSIGWENFSADSQIITIDGDDALRLRQFGGWSQFFPLNGASEYQIATLIGFRSSLDGNPTGWSGFGITYYDSTFNTIEVFETEILPNDKNLPMGELRYEVSAKRPERALFANVWVWNAYGNTETIVDELLVANYFPDNEYTISSSLPPGLRYGDPHQPGENLIANGTFQQFAVLDDGTPVEFGRTQFWNKIEPVMESGFEFSEDGLIRIGAVSDSTVMWQIVDIAPLRKYNILAEVVREVIAGEMTFDGRPWAAIGVDYFDANWEFLGKAELQINGNRIQSGVPIPDPFPTRTRDFLTPAAARNAVFWIWIEGSGPERFAPLKIQSLSLRQEVSDDTDPPIANPVAQVIDQPSNTFHEFTVQYIDNQEMGFSVPGPDIRVSGPDGSIQELDSIAGGGSQVERFLVYQFQPPGGSFGPEDNGRYTVTVIAEQIVDAAGNAMPEQSIGAIEVAIE